MLPPDQRQIRWVIGIDGSLSEVPVSGWAVSSLVGYVQVSAALIYLEELERCGKETFISPDQLQKAVRSATLPLAVPGANICRVDCSDVRSSWRREIYEIFRDYQVESLSLLEIYFDLLCLGQGASPGIGHNILLNRCPSCGQRNVTVGKHGGQCIHCRERLYPTDALRIHEEVSELGSNLGALGRLMNVIEHLVLFAYLEQLLRHYPHLLGKVAFLIDDPLAVFGPAAALKTAFSAYLQHAGERLRQGGYAPPVVIGLEKSGQYVDHARQIAGSLTGGTLMRLPDEYIQAQILSTRSENVMRATYYGRKFFYKTRQDRTLVITIPRWDAGSVTDADQPSHYPALRASLDLLDRVWTAMYDDAVYPIALAHTAAAIPAKMGTRALKLFSKQISQA